MAKDKSDIVLDTDKPSKAWVILLTLGIIGMVGGVACTVGSFLIPAPEVATDEYPTLPSSSTSEKIYSDLTGLEISSKSENSLPTFCIQTPNGTDGARPQAGRDGVEAGRGASFQSFLHGEALPRRGEVPRRRQQFRKSSTHGICDTLASARFPPQSADGRPSAP